MPTDPTILGFSNLWYEEAIANADTITLDSGAKIRAAKPVVLIGTKFSAWKGRGEGDLLRSLDILDVLTLINGRRELAAEVEAAPPDLRAYVRDELVELQTERDFDYAVDSATATYGPVGADRADLVRERIHQLILRC